MPGNRHHEFIRFLKKIDKETQFGLHLIVENYCIHKHPQVKSCQTASHVTSAFYPKFKFVVKFGWTAVCRDYQQANTIRFFQNVTALIKNHQRLPRKLQSKPPGICVECASGMYIGGDLQM